MKNLQLPLLKELYRGGTERLGPQFKPYDLPLDFNQTGEQQAKSLAILGYEHGREWLNAPHNQPLSYLRLIFKSSVIDALKRGEFKSPSVQDTAVGIMELVALYNVGLDQALEEFVLLAKAMPHEGTS
jgi:hypothetical protein